MRYNTTGGGETSLSSCFQSTLPLTFPGYNAVNTNFGQQNTADEEVYVCPGTTLSLTQCSGGGSYDAATPTQLRLYDEGGTELAAAEYSCGNGAEITHTFTAPCQTYTLSQGCEGADACTGTTAIVVQGKLDKLFIGSKLF